MCIVVIISFPLFSIVVMFKLTFTFLSCCFSTWPKTSEQRFSQDSLHYVKRVQIRSFFWSLFSRIRIEYGKNGPEKLYIWKLSRSAFKRNTKYFSSLLKGFSLPENEFYPAVDLLSKILEERVKLSFNRNWCIKLITSAVFFTKETVLLKLPTHFGFKYA